ncbi:MAG TPA: rhodanese-like domain-containing protein [Steroidobacteraceae bacterium]|nr:rhodanese-like domain-containing protein [Steroidobacteraceae bacterium]
MQQFLQYADNHRYLVGAAVLIAVLVAINELRARAASFGSIAPGEAVRLMNGGALLIDVRGREEFAAGHIAGARHVPGATIADGAQALERFKDKPVIAYCNTGMTAGAAARHLGRLGFKHVYNVRGGLAAWRQDNLPVVKG